MLTRWFALVFLAAFSAELCNILLVHFPGYLLTLGADEVRIGLIVGAAGLAGLAVRPWVGRVMDRHGRRLVIRSGTLMVALSTLAMAFLGTLGMAVIAARVMQVLGQAAAITAFWTYIADRVPPENRAQGIALFGISGLLPIGVAPALGDFVLTTEWGYRGLFVIAAVLALVAFGLSLSLQDSGRSAGAKPSGFGPVLRSETLRPIWLVTAVLSIGFTTSFIFVKTYAATTGLNSVGPFFTAFALSAILWRLVFGRVPDRLGAKTVIGPGLAAYASGLALVALVGGTAGLAVGGFLAGLGHGASFPVILAMATTRAGEGDRGTVTAVFTAVFDLVLFAAAPLLGLLIAGLGYTAMFLTASGAVWGGMALFYRYDRGNLNVSPTTELETAPVPHW